MPRYIDADALKQKAQKVATESWKMKIKANVETTLNQFIDWINAEPTIEPQRTGKWIRQNPMVDTEECSECGWNILSNEMETSYCPNCGAKMKGGEADEC